MNEEPTDNIRRKRNRQTNSPKTSSMMETTTVAPYVVIGGGIAGVSCAQELASTSKQPVILISSSNILKEAVGVMEVTKFLQDVSVFEKSSSRFVAEHPGVQVIIGVVISLNHIDKTIILQDETCIRYDKVCICSGATPQLILHHPRVVGIRDTESVDDLFKRLQLQRRVIIIGNGGIALELVHALDMCDIDWIVKDSYIGSAFFDAMASQFISPMLFDRVSCSDKHDTSSRSAADIVCSCSDMVSSDTSSGSYAVGPDWDARTGFSKALKASHHDSGIIKMHYKQEVVAIYDVEDGIWILTSKINISELHLPHIDTSSSNGAAIYVYTTAGDLIAGDFIVSATGVKPMTAFLSSDFDMTEDGALIVDDYMMTSIHDIYAAGDCCSYHPRLSENDISDPTESMWFQMRLWSQAKQQGAFAATCMMADNHEDIVGTFIFELFTHSTRFFGFKVVLLGRYNAQGYDDEYMRVVREFEVHEGELRALQSHEHLINPSSHAITNLASSAIEIWIRITVGQEYIKLVVYHGRVIGAMLIGATELAETFENLILNRINVQQLGIAILDLNIDLEDYFD